MTGGSRRADSGNLLANERKIEETAKAIAAAQSEAKKLAAERAAL